MPVCGACRPGRVRRGVSGRPAQARAPLVPFARSEEVTGDCHPGGVRPRPRRHRVQCPRRGLRPVHWATAPQTRGRRATSHSSLPCPRPPAFSPALDSLNTRGVCRHRRQLRERRGSVRPGSPVSRAPALGADGDPRSSDCGRAGGGGSAARGRRGAGAPRTRHGSLPVPQAAPGASPLEAARVK